MIRQRPLLMTLALVVVPVLPALAHGGEALTAGTALSTWRLTADIVIPTALVTLIYVRGMLRGAAVTEPVAWWRMRRSSPVLMLRFGCLNPVMRYSRSARGRRDTSWHCCCAVVPRRTTRTGCQLRWFLLAFSGRAYRRSG